MRSWLCPRSHCGRFPPRAGQYMRSWYLRRATPQTIANHIRTKEVEAQDVSRRPAARNAVELTRSAGQLNGQGLSRSMLGIWSSTTWTSAATSHR